MTSRRDFLKVGTFATMAAGLPVRSYGATPMESTPIGVAPRAGDPVLRDLALRALDAAKGAGATYADARITMTRTQSYFYGNPPIDREEIAIGVRVLANGAWGFAASPLWTLDEAARLGRDATVLAKGNRWRHAPPIELGERPAPAVGEWHMPVARDPFTVSVDEKLDYIRSLSRYARVIPNAGATVNIVFRRQERTFASTDGAMCTQTVYRTFGGSSMLVISYRDPKTGQLMPRWSPRISPVGVGYEALTDPALVESFAELADEARRMTLALEPVTASRYDVVFDGYAMAAILGGSLGTALEVDRALGLEANAGGTSYLAPVNDILGTTIGPAMLNVVANRSRPGGVATVRWDDEGVAPTEAALITNGVVTDYQTSREHMSTLDPWYQRHGLPRRSHGGAGSVSAMDVPVVHPANLQMLPGKDDVSFDELVARVGNGIAVKGGLCMMDHQQLTGQGLGEVVYRIKNGKLDEPMKFGAGFMFRSSEFWKNLSAIGGARSSVWRGMTARKGEPNQEMAYSVGAPAAVVKNVAVLDIMNVRVRAASAGAPPMGIPAGARQGPR